MHISRVLFTFYLILLFPFYSYSLESIINLDAVKIEADYILQDILEKYSDSDPNEYWQSYTLINNEQREDVQIEKVEKKSIQGNYLAWKHVQIGPSYYLIGLLHHSIHLYVLLESDLRKVAEIDTWETLVQMTVFTKWNDVYSLPEIIIPVATTEPSIVVYKVTNQVITKFPQVWPIQYQIDTLKFTYTGLYTKLILSPIQENFPIYIYNFAVNGTDSQFWFHQRIPVIGKSFITIFDIGQDSAIAIATHKIVNIYLFDIQKEHYKISQTIHLISPSTQLVSFTLAYQPFLASTSELPNNIEFFSLTASEFIQEQKFGQISAVQIHPVSIADYHDKPFLITKQTDGKVQFRSFDPKQKSFEIGFSCDTVQDICTTRADLSNGANFFFNGTAMYVLPSEKFSHLANIFIISKRIQQTSSTQHQNSRILYLEYELLSKHFKRWEDVTTNTRVTLQNSLSRKNSNSITGSWKLTKLSGSEIIIKDDSNTHSSEHNIASIGNTFDKFTFVETLWDNIDFGVKLFDVDKKIQELEKKTHHAWITIEDSVHLNSNETHIIKAKQKISGSLRANILDANEIQVQEINEKKNISNFFNNMARKENNLNTKSCLKFHGSLDIDDMETLTLRNIHVYNIPRLAEKNIFHCPLQFAVQFKELGDIHSHKIGDVQLSTEVIKAKDIHGVKFSNGIVALKEATISTPINSIKIHTDVFKKLFLRSTNQVISAPYSFLEVHTVNNVRLKIMNGKLFESLIDSIVSKDFQDIIKGTKIVLGKIKTNSMTIRRKLNDIQFPDGFILGRSRSVVSGHKTFERLSTNTISLDGKINNINTENIVSALGHTFLKRTWTMTENITFLDDLIVKNNVDGIKMESLKHKDTLDQIKSNYYPNADIVFKQPVHFGSLSIKTTINQKNFIEIFGGLLLLNSSVTSVRGLTIFKNNVTFDALLLKTGKVNSFNLNDLFTLNTPQNITGSKILTKFASFSTLYGLGKFDSIILSKISEDAFRLSQVRTISSKLFFENISCGSTMKVHGQINNFINFSSDVVVLNGRENHVFHTTVEFDQFHTKSLQINKQLQVSDGKAVGGLYINSWFLQKISLSKPGRILVSFEILGTAKVLRNVFTPKINGILLSHLSFGVLRSDRTQQTFTKEFVSTSLIKVVNGQVIFHQELSGFSLSSVIGNAFHINRNIPEVIGSTWHFEKLVLKNDLNVNGTTCHVDLRKLDLDGVRKGDSNIHILGSKIFKSGFEIKHVLKVNKINNIDYFINIFTLYTNQNVKEKVLFGGNVFVKSLTGNGFINGVSLSELARIYSFQNETTHVLNYDVEAENSITLSALFVAGLVQTQDFNKFLKGKVAKTTQSLKITGTKTFTQSIWIGGNADVNTLNQINLNKFFNQIIRKNEGIIFKYPVTFLNHVETTEFIIKKGNLKGPEIIDDVSLTELLATAFYISSKIITVPLTFDFCTIMKNVEDVITLNGIPMKDIVTLNQQINVGTLHTKEAYLVGKNVEIGGLFGGHNIQKEYENTLWRNSSRTQLIIGFKTFEGFVKFRKNLKCLGIHKNQIVSIQQNRSIHSKVEFAQPIHVKGDLEITGLVNGYSIHNMLSNSLTNARDEEITGYWTFNEGVTFKKDVGGQGLLNGYDISQIIPAKLTETKNVEDNIKQEIALYEEKCRVVDSLFLRASESPVKLHSFDSHQKITLDKPIKKLITVKSSKYLHILGFSKSCEIIKYEWISKDELFLEKPSKLRLGFVTSWSSVDLRDEALLVSVVNQHHHGDRCSSLSSGIYITTLSVDGTYSDTLSLETGHFIDVQLVKNDNHVGLFALSVDHITLISFMYDKEKHVFLQKHQDKLNGPVFRFQSTSYKEGATIFYHCKIAVHMNYFSFKTEKSHEIGETKFLASNDTRDSTIVLFSSQNALYGLVETFQESIIQSDCTLQAFELYNGEMRKFQQLKNHHTLSISKIELDNQIYLGILNKYAGISISKFSGLAGFETLSNENLITVSGGIELISFTVNTWNTSISTPFLAVSTKKSIEIFHSNVQGDHPYYPSKNVCKVL